MREISLSFVELSLNNARSIDHRMIEYHPYHFFSQDEKFPDDRESISVEQLVSGIVEDYR